MVSQREIDTCLLKIENDARFHEPLQKMTRTPVSRNKIGSKDALKIIRYCTFGIERFNSNRWVANSNPIVALLVKIEN